jgi:hypothetical protein
MPRHVDKEDEVRKIKEAANELIVLSESTLGDGDVGECSATAKDVGDTPVSALRRSTRFSKSVSSASSPQRVLISDSTALPPPGPPNANDVYVGSTSSSVAGKDKVLGGELPKGTPSNPVRVSESDVSGPHCRRRRTKKSGRKAKGGKRSASVTNRKWQDSWATSFPWAEKCHEEDVLVLSVKCLVCTRIDGRPKTLCLKRDNLNKHAGWYKAAGDMHALGVKDGEWYRDHENRHFKNEKLFASLTKATVLEQLNMPVEFNWTKKKAQFIVVLFLLLNGRPMLDYHAYKELFNFLNVPFVPFKHWSVNSGWGIAECLGQIVDRAV